MAGLTFNGVDVTDAYLDGTFVIPPEQMSGEMKAQRLRRLIELTVRRKDPHFTSLVDSLSFESRDEGRRIWGQAPKYFSTKKQTIVLLTFAQPPAPRKPKHIGDCRDGEQPPTVPERVLSRHLLLMRPLRDEEAPYLMQLAVTWEAFWEEPHQDDDDLSWSAYTPPLSWKATYLSTSPVSDEVLAELLMQPSVDPVSCDALEQACYRLAQLDLKRVEMYESKCRDERHRSGDVQGMLARMGIKF